MNDSIDAPQIAEAEPQLVAVLHITVKRSEIREVMGPGIGEVMAALAVQGIAPIGPWFTHHLKRPSDIFDFDVCVPTATQVAAVGRVRPEQLPAMRVARTIYRGPYEGLAAAWGELLKWITAEGLTPAGDLFERYLIDPKSNPDPASWRTELSRPLVL